MSATRRKGPDAETEGIGVEEKKGYHKHFTGVLVGPDGTRRHFINGAYGREDDGPSVEYTDGGFVYYVRNPKAGGFNQRLAVEHRVGEPAVGYANGARYHYKFGVLHRDPEEGPAAIWPDGTFGYFVDGKPVPPPEKTR